VDTFEQFFVAGRWLVWLVLLPLSLVVVKLAVENCLRIRRVKLLPVGLVDRVGRLIKESQSVESLRGEESLLGKTIYVGLAQRSHGRVAMENAMAEMLEQETTHLLRKIEWLNIIGNVAPMIGLFGTVWGMIDAFNAIVLAGGQPEPANLAGGISVALVTTWWGLVVAIPALAVYGFLRNKIDILAAEAAVTAEELLRECE
jgi:biopolymer transport protein ExbB